MTDVRVVPEPPLDEKRRAFVLAEDRVGHYPEFRSFFIKEFDLDRLGLSKAGCVIAPSGRSYTLIFIGRSGEIFPSGVEIYAIVDALEPLDAKIVDKDLWAILGWIVEGAGAPWTRNTLEETGRLFRIPAAGAP